MSEHNVWTTTDPDTIRRDIQHDMELMSDYTGWDLTQRQVVIDQKLSRLSELVGRDVTIDEVLN